MARLRQLNPQNYHSSGMISAEFENLFRYLVAAELGHKTLGELLRQLFDEDGVWAGPVALRNDSEAGLQYRIGRYDDPTDGWITLATPEDIRGMPGEMVGEIGEPVISQRVDFVATAGQTAFDYAHDASDDLLVYVDGVLQRDPQDYSHDPAGGSTGAGGLTFSSGLNDGDVVTVLRIRAALIPNYQRADYDTVAPQQVFAFVHQDGDRLQVYLNGVLLRDGGSHDYTTQPEANTVTLNTPVAPGNVVSIVSVERSDARSVTGLMTEETYVDPNTGLIRFAAIAIPDDAIAAAKVAGLVSLMGERAKMTAQATAPVTPETGEFWLDTAQAPNQLKVWDGTQWLRTSPESSLPTFTTADAGRFVRVNGTGTALEYGQVDLSSVIAVTQRGAANGVASLDSNGRLPFAQLPQVLASESLYLAVATPANQQYDVKRIFQQKVSIEGLSVRTTSGSCTVRVQVDGVAVGSSVTANSVGNDVALGSPIEIDASVAGKSIGFEVTANASAADLEVTLAMKIISS